jgi:hypothetical protein
MSGYVKLFSEIIDSSIWSEPHSTRVVWITLLALSDCDGYVRGSIGWLAGKAKVTNAECRAAIAKFLSPDPHSRTPDHDGRRIEALEDGWLVLNYLAFRDRLSSDPKAIATRERVRKHRERYMALRNAESVTPAVPASASVSVHASASSFGKKGGVGEGKHQALELPPYFPKSEEEAITACTTLGVDDQFVRSTWNKAASRGGLDAKQVPITRFANYVKTEWTYEQQRRSTQTRISTIPSSNRQVDHSKGF